VADLRIDPERSSFDVSTRPGIAGLGARVLGATGSFRLSFDRDGRVDLDQPIAGAFAITVGDLRTGNRWVTARLPWLGIDDRAVIAGTVSEARPARDGRLDIPMMLEVGGRTVAALGTGRVDLRDDGSVEAVGGTLCDPRSFDVPLPPLINLSVFVRWRVRLDA
jgi:hypothetical protein